MSDRRSGSFSDDDDLAETARHVSEVLGRHADRIEPRHDAYARLAARVDDARPRMGTGLRSWLPTPQLALAVTVAAMALVGGIAVVNGTRNDEPTGSASAVTGGTTTTGPQESSSTTAATEDTAADRATAEGEEDGTDDVVGNPGIVVPLAGGIARDSRAEAATAFLAHLGVAPTSITVVGDQVIVNTEREGGGEGPEIATLEVVPVAIDDVDRWIVMEAKSSDVVISAPLAQAKVSGDQLVVSGQGTGFEGWVDIEIRAATDGRVLVRGGARAGNLGELAEFSATLPMVGAEQAWVIVSSSSGTDEIASAFAALPISSVGAPDTRTYRVVHIGENDPDNGLNLRSGPGSNNPVVRVLDRGDAVTRQADEVPVRNGSSIWWPVTTGDGTAGWAASQFLAADGPLGDEALADAAGSVLLTAFNPDAAPGSIQGSVLGVTIAAGSSQEEVRSATLLDPAGWRAPLAVLGDRSLAEVANVPLDWEADLTVDVDGPVDGDPATSRILSRYLGGLPHVTVAYTDGDDVRRTIHLVFEAAPTGAAALVGIVFA